MSWAARAAWGGSAAFQSRQLIETSRDDSMNLQETDGQAEFRQQVRRWIDEEVPPHLKGLRQGIVQGPGLTQEELTPLTQALAKQGWLAPEMPKERGGGGFDFMQAVIFREECSRAGLPRRYVMGLEMLAPILLEYGTEAQKKRFLEPTIRGEIQWAQGYSEPGAGSDLASLAMRAEVTDDGFILNGQKIWTSGAHHANWIFCLVRTDPKPARKQQGISFLLADMKSPGITVRPIVTIEGFSHFCEVFFENVKVPKDQLVGELDKGWKVAKALLGHERFGHPTADPFVMFRAIEDVKKAARGAPQGEGTVWDDPALRRRVAALEMDAADLQATRARYLTRIQEGEAPGPEAMIFKLFGAELMQRIVELHQEVVGPEGVSWGPEPFGTETGEVAVHAVNIRAATLRGGTSEVHRNIVAQRILGLPD
ncbi:MAG: acyl-CoA dehydrogenase family protein [SAR324 cluster bacterium]|nr:acyl-CoA dehydrogenase family protein [SAR324 cluster bacterium]